jgi:hypothetical protein
VRKLALGATIAVLTVASGASGQPQSTSPGVLLSKHWLGVYRLGPTGGLQQLVGRDIRPLAVKADGTTAGVKAADAEQNGPLFLIRGASQIEFGHSTGGVRCAAFSADGSVVAYITGKAVLTKPSPDLDYFRVDGTLWIADIEHPQQAHAIDAGAFTLPECPLPAPSGQRFAYFIQTSSGDWELRLYRDGGIATIADDPGPVPSNHDRSFAWAPNGALGFVRGDDLWAGQRRIATNLTATLAPRPNIRYGRAIDFSSDGRLVAVSFGQRTGIFRSSGRLVRVVPGHLIDWSGSRGVLTIGVTKQAIIVLRRFPLNGQPRILARFFKLPAVSAPTGAWFGYPVAQSRRFVFRRSDGSLLRNSYLGFIGVPLAATDRSGRLSVPAGSY